ncbi:MAG: hypothetical protein O7F73_20100 [Gammaproteobacteria bacterium]|nr:hypothetical protein [Gammaproteobacteria bacterium]
MKPEFTLNRWFAGVIALVFLSALGSAPLLGAGWFWGIGNSPEGDLMVTSNFQVVMWHRDEQRLFAGTYQHHLQIHGEDFLIRHKRVELINPETAHKSIII